MSSYYARWMYDWENRLCSAATNRVVRPFDWGLEWTRGWPVTHPEELDNPHALLRDLNLSALANSDAFFDYKTPADFSLQDKLVRFTSPVETPYEENNRVHGVWFPAE